MEQKLKKLVAIILIVALALLAIFVLWPILIAVITGLIFAYIFFPVYKRILKVVKERNISALIVVILIIILIFIPLWFLFPIVTRQIFDIYSFSQKVDILGVLKGILPEALSKDTIVLVNNFISNLVNSLLSSFSVVLSNLTITLLRAVVVLFVFFFSMRDADKLKEYAKGLSPFSNDLEKTILKQFEDITSSVIYGHIVVGIIQGILTGIGLLIFGVPQVLLLTILAILASIIPVLGAWLIWIPASIYLLATGHIGTGIGLFLFGAILVSWIDNILRPYIVSRRTNISSGIIFVGMIGGLIVFGVIGLILGPLILAYVLILIDAYKEKKFENFLS